jgi:hypothetical protein
MMMPKANHRSSLYFGKHGNDRAGLHIAQRHEFRPIFIAEGKIEQEVSRCGDAFFGEQSGALLANTAEIFDGIFQVSGHYSMGASGFMRAAKAKKHFYKHLHYFFVWNTWSIAPFHGSLTMYSLQRSTTAGAQARVDAA